MAGNLRKLRIEEEGRGQGIGWDTFTSSLLDRVTLRNLSPQYRVFLRDNLHQWQKELAGLSPAAVSTKDMEACILRWMKGGLTLLERKPHPESGYRSCLGIMRLSKSYGQQRTEAASARAVACGACTYGSLKSILQSNLDQVPLKEPENEAPTPLHQNLRGPGYYSEEGTSPC